MKSLKALNKYFKRYKHLLILGFIFIAISNLFGVYPAQVVRHGFNLVKENLLFYQLTNELDLQREVFSSFNGILFVFAGIIIVFALIKGLFMFFMRQTIIIMSRKIEYDMKNDIYDHFQRLSLSFYRRNNTGDLMARITEDVSRVRMYTGPAIMYTINMFTLIILVVTIMLTVNARLTLLVLMPLPVLAISIYFVNKIIHQRSTEIQAQLSKLTTFVQEVFSGIKVIKSFSAEKHVKDHFSDEVNEYRVRSMKLVKVDAMFFPLVLLLIGLSTLITLYAGGRQVMTGHITPGNIAEFFIYVNLLSWPVASIGWVTSLIQRSAASQARINQLMQVEPDISPEEGKEVRIKGEIEFKDVSFTYPDTGIKALQNVSFKIEAGTSLGIIGKTGSGKSTVASLLLRSYDATSGDIFIDGENLKDLHPGFYRKQIGYVPQDDFLFSNSIANNIKFGFHDDLQEKPVTDEEFKERMKEMAIAADVYKDILDFPDGFETSLGERGITLSGGQKQRVAIARAMIGDPKILIFDDSFSAIDTHTEAQILSNLSQLMTNKTTVFISHRVSTVKKASHIIVLDNGKITEQGSHDELVQTNGYYASLHNKQQLEKEMYEKDN